MQVIVKEYIVQYQRKEQTDHNVWNHGSSHPTLERAIECSEEYFKRYAAVRVVENEIRLRYAKWK